MSNNVIILGAGFSYDAGIPLLGGFVERMWEFAARKTHNGQPLASADLEIFEDAIKVKSELDSYHGRAVFNDRNIEEALLHKGRQIQPNGARECNSLSFLLWNYVTGRVLGIPSPVIRFIALQRRRTSIL